jgi:hypothetical protein
MENAPKLSQVHLLNKSLPAILFAPGPPSRRRCQHFSALADTFLLRGFIYRYFACFLGRFEDICDCDCILRIQMKKGFIHVSICLLFILGASGWAHAQVGDRKPTGGISIGTTNSPIPIDVLHEVLAAAAPSYNMTVANFIRLYYSCGCIIVEQLGPQTYRVTYGGIGILIVIDATRGGNGMNRASTR